HHRRQKKKHDLLTTNHPPAPPARRPLTNHHHIAHCTPQSFPLNIILAHASAHPPPQAPRKPRAGILRTLPNPHTLYTNRNDTQRRCVSSPPSPAFFLKWKTKS